MPEKNLAWPHAPTHQLSEAGSYFVTAGTYGKAHHFRGAERLGVLQRGLLKLTAEYLTRLNYVHQNPVKHRLVAVANEYPWCSARWFERMTSSAQIRGIYRFKIDAVQVFDEYEPLLS